MREVLIPQSLNCLISTHSNNGFISANGGLVQFTQRDGYQPQRVSFTLNEVDKRSEIKTAATHFTSHFFFLSSYFTIEELMQL